MQELNSTADEPVVVQCQEVWELGAGCCLEERGGQANAVLEVQEIGLPFAQRLLEDRFDASIEIKVLNLCGMLKVVDNSTDPKTVELLVEDLIVSALGGALPAKDPHIMMRGQAAAELVGILLDASSGGGRKSVGYLKDSHRLEKTRLSSHRASRVTGPKPVNLLGLGSDARMKTRTPSAPA
jgi:hypothetical protein